VRAGNTQFRRANRRGTPGGYRAKLATVRVARADGSRVLLRAPLVTAWPNDPRFDDKVRPMDRWWQGYAQAAD
jgi:hypothetical protein